MFTEDKTVVPKESSWFGSEVIVEDIYSPQRVLKDTRILVPMHEQPLYQEDWIGLREEWHVTALLEIHPICADLAHFRAARGTSIRPYNIFGGTTRGRIGGTVGAGQGITTATPRNRS